MCRIQNELRTDLGCRVSSFDLHKSPFRLLNAMPEASPAELLELAEVAEFDGDASARELSEARQSLVTPRLRLASELGWLQDLTKAQIADLFAWLEHLPTPNIIERVRHWPELARANIAAHLCGHRLENPRAAIHELMETWEIIEPEHVLKSVNAARRESQFPLVAIDAVQDGLEHLRQRHAAVAAEAIWRAPPAGKLMNDLVEQELELDPSVTFLRLLVREYDRQSEPELARIGEAIEDAARRRAPIGWNAGRAGRQDRVPACGMG
jgi:hypothetical protein